jgi:hypothetical protein
MKNILWKFIQTIVLTVLFFLLSERSDAGNGPTHHTFRPYRFSFDSLVSKKDSADTAKTVKHRKFTPGVAWASNNTFMGRKDSVDHYLLSPSFAYEGKYGVSASITASHTSLPTTPTKDKSGKTVKPGKTPTFDEYDMALGYDHDWTDNFSSGILETHNFYDAKSSRLKSTIDNDLNLNSSYDFKYIAAEVSGDWAHGKKTAYGQSKDYFYTFTLSHQFEIDHLFHTAWELDIEPKADAIYGTQNFYLIYTKGKPLDSTQIKKVDYQKQLSKYNWLNYEFKLPITFTNDKWSLSPEWDYEVPINVPRGSPSLPFSVYTVTLTYTFKTKN